MNRSIWPAAFLVAGLILLLIGPLMLAMLPANTFWNEADQAAYQDASTEAHAATYGGVHDHSQPHSHELPTAAEGKALLEAARAKLEKQNARLQAAQALQAWLRVGCRVLGGLAVLGGIGLYVRSRRLSPSA